jgi:hypothetical protein
MKTGPRGPDWDPRVAAISVSGCEVVVEDDHSALFRCQPRKA